MNSRRVTIVVSDLHLGGGESDRSDDFVYQADHFPTLLAELQATPEGRAGETELFINGDFLDFLQVCPEAYKIDSAKYWCTESESLRKLKYLTEGHKSVFAALNEFQKPGNLVTITPGNHDIDLHWAGVQSELQRVAGPVTFEMGATWFSRYLGKLRISHGNQIEPANAFSYWANPIRLAKHGEKRLEMCPGTLFVVKFVNWLEGDYRFAANLHPVTKLAGILAREDRFGFIAAGWVLSKFAARYPEAALDYREQRDVGRELGEALQVDDDFAQEIASLYSSVYDEPCTSVDKVRSILKAEVKFAEFLLDALSHVDAESWLALLEQAKPATLSVGGSTGTLAIARSGRLGKAHWRSAAEEQWENGAQIVVIGHTHEADTTSRDEHRYYNPGSWTRFVTERDLDGLTLSDLQDESRFRWELNYVRIERDADGFLTSEMRCWSKKGLSTASEATDRC